MWKILVVDDNQPSRELLRYFLGGPDRLILQAEDGPGAVAATEEFTPDLVLLDLQLPVWSGYQVLGRIRENPRCRAVPVIAVTAAAMSGERERALSAGFDAFIVKPIDGARLRAAVARLLHNGTWKENHASR